MDIKAKIEELVQKYPKHFSQMIKRDADLLEWITTHAPTSSTFSEQVHRALTNEIPICENGSVKKFKSIKDGYGYCGTTRRCICAKDNISRKVSETKNAYTQEKQHSITQKRMRTTMERYGVTNNGQTDTAKKRHKECYADIDNVSSIITKYQATLMARYGANVKNARDIPGVSEKIANTLYELYGVKNISHIPGVTEKAQDTKSTKYDYSSLMLSHAYTRLSNKYKEAGITWLIQSDEYCGINKSYLFECDVCEHTFTDKLHGGHTVPICRQCNPVYGSHEQMEVYDYIKSLGITNILSNDRTILGGKELDIYLPDYNLAIEYNGAYWHNDTKLDKHYHYDKFMMCKARNITMLSIFSPHWKHNTDVVKSLIRHKLNKSVRRIYARKCQIREVDSAAANEFLCKTHIFGNSVSPIRYGLYFEDELVSLMLFSKPRLGIGKNQDGYELVRYASNCSVVGGASKLLAHFIKTHPCNQIYSFSDNCFSDGNLYEVLKFTKNKEYKSGYWYCDPSDETLHHRFKFRKDVFTQFGLDKADFTEREMMDWLGYWRIWDCGKVKWVLSVTQP